MKTKVSQISNWVVHTWEDSIEDGLVFTNTNEVKMPIVHTAYINLRAIAKGSKTVMIGM